MKVGIVGAGAVGTACLFAMALRGSAREIVLVNRNYERARGAIADLQYGAILAPAVSLRPGDYDDLRGAAMARVEAALGSPERPLDEAGLERKMSDLGGDRLAGALDDPERPAAELLELAGLRRARPRPAAGSTIAPPDLAHGDGGSLMAEEIQIAGAGTRPRRSATRSGCSGSSLITLGIYFFFWWYFINREMRDLGQARGTDLGENPGNSVLAITLGALIIVPAIVTEWTTSGRIQRSQETVGLERPASGPVIFILLLLISPVGLWYVQSELNKVWRSLQGGGARARPRSRPPAGQPAPPVESRPEVPGRSSCASAGAAASSGSAGTRNRSVTTARAPRAGHHGHVLDARALRARRRGARAAPAAAPRAAPPASPPARTRRRCSGARRRRTGSTRTTRAGRR